jgi:hypothetical protein
MSYMGSGFPVSIIRLVAGLSFRQVSQSFENESRKFPQTALFTHTTHLLAPNLMINFREFATLAGDRFQLRSLRSSGAFQPIARLSQSD